MARYNRDVMQSRIPKKPGQSKASQEKFTNPLGEIFNLAQASSDFRKLAGGFGKDLADVQRKAILYTTTKHVGKIQSFIKEMDRKLANANQLEGKAKTQALASVAKEFKVRWDNEERLIDHREKAAEEANAALKKNLGQRAEEFGESLKDSIEGVLAGGAASLGGFANLFKKVGGGAERKGMGLKESSVGVNKALGETLARLGPILIGVGAIVGTFAAVAAVIIQADAQAKEFNKTILSGVSAGDLGVKRYGEMAGALDDMREAALGLRAFGTTAEENLAVLNAYVKAGLTYGEIRDSITGATTATDKYTSAMKTALVYAHLFGEEATSIASTAGEMVEEMGLTIGGVEERFASLYKKAMQSGFGVQRFYGMVLQATSGLGMYNVRIEEAAEFLKRLGKVLGPKTGAEFMSSLTKGFSEEGMQERYKRVMVTGQPETKGVFQRSAERTGGDFLKKLGEKFKDPSLQANITSALDAAGLDMSSLQGKGAAGGQAMVDALAGLNPKQQSILLARIAGANADLGRMMETLVGLTKGAKGGIDEQAANLDKLDMGAKLTMWMKAGGQMFQKPIHELGAVERMGFEHVTGVSGEMFEQLRRISKNAYGSWDAMEGVQRDLKASGMNEIQARIEMVKQFGGYINGSGEKVRAELNSTQDAIETSSEPIKTVQEWLEVTAGTSENMEKVMTDNEKWAMTTADNTTELTKLIQQRIQQVLENIYDVVQSIGGFLGTEMSTNQKAMRNEAADQFRGKADLEYEKILSAENKLTELKTLLKEAAGDPTKSTEIQKKIDKEILSKEEAQVREQVYREAADKVASTEEEYSSTKDYYDLGTSTTAATLDRISKARGVTNQFQQEAKFAGSAFEQEGVPSAAKWVPGLSKAVEGYGTNAYNRDLFDALEEGDPEVYALLETQQKEAKPNSPESQKKAKIAQEGQIKAIEKTAGENAKLNAKANYEFAERAEAEDLVRQAGILDETAAATAVEGLLRGFVSPGLNAALSAEGSLPQPVKSSLSTKLLDRFAVMPTDELMANLPEAEDFMLRLGGDRIEGMKINSGDQILGAKPGGPVAALGAGRGQGGVVNITINGNEERAYAVVRKALQATGLA